MSSIKTRVEDLERQAEPESKSLAAALVAARGKPFDPSASRYPVIERARDRVRRQIHLRR